MKLSLEQLLTPLRARREDALGSMDAARPVDLMAVTRALSIRQPFAEQIMRGTKQVEHRRQPTRIRGRVYVYASLTPGEEGAWKSMRARPGEFPAGMLIGTVEIVDCTGAPGDYEWHLRDPVRLEQPLKPARKPQPTWFIPFED